MTAAPLCRLALSCLLFAAPSWAVAQTASSQFRVEAAVGTFVTAARINLRQLPDAQSKRIGVLEAGEKVQVTGKVANSQWVAVLRADGAAGFVLSDLLRPTAAPTSAALPKVEAAPIPAPPPPDIAAELTRRLAAVEERLNKLVAENAAAQQTGEARDAAQDEALQAVSKEQQALARLMEAMRTELAEPQNLKPVNDKVSALSERLDQALAQIAAAQETAATQLAAARESLAALAAASPEKREGMTAEAAQALTDLRAELTKLARGSENATIALSIRIEAIAEELNRYHEQQNGSWWGQTQGWVGGAWNGAASIWDRLWWGGPPR